MAGWRKRATQTRICRSRPSDVTLADRPQTDCRWRCCHNLEQVRFGGPQWMLLHGAVEEQRQGRSRRTAGVQPAPFEHTRREELFLHALQPTRDASRRGRGGLLARWGCTRWAGKLWRAAPQTEEQGSKSPSGRLRPSMLTTTQHQRGPTRPAAVVGTCHEGIKDGIVATTANKAVGRLAARGELGGPGCGWQVTDSQEHSERTSRLVYPCVHHSPAARALATGAEGGLLFVACTPQRLRGVDGLCRDVGSRGRDRAACTPCQGSHFEELSRPMLGSSGCGCSRANRVEERGNALRAAAACRRPDLICSSLGPGRVRGAAPVAPAARQ
ncbi:hypothetical protein BU16DRAFT_538285 [Lophium mytilinum]|uniref:Uncharacterized protein n=1 Tax=Lophium mytilinum TaxID=390894 RepID=A0A6A6QXJ8_9PEZI|nr:hypothetical protein BU16DRAFT_538285 [Lophium mytilinum]